MADPSTGLELMIPFFRFNQRGSNSSLKFGRLTAKMAEVFGFQFADETESTISI